jgi:signal transduction histidine kinase
VIAALLSGAGYIRYRTAAWQTFDAGLRDDLASLQGALAEELAEAREGTEVLPQEAGADPWRVAAARAIEEFRLNGLSAEIRKGGGDPALLARLSLGDASDAAVLPAPAWREAARNLSARYVDLGGQRALVRGFRAAGEPDPIVIAVAGRTAELEGALSAIRRDLFAYGAVGLILALAGGYWLATRALRPIDAMTRQAGFMAASAAVAPGRLDIGNFGDELGRLASTFNLLLERIALSAARTKSFIADAAHELKTPVSIVRTGAELALSGERTPGDYREALGAISLECVHLSDLVSDLTLLAEGELLEQPVERRLVDLTELVAEVVRSLGALAASRGIRVEIDAASGLEYRGDERLLRRVAVNLLENAIKFSREGARVGVRLTRRQDRVELAVADEAFTLSGPETDRVFERFYRSQQSRSEGIPGSGLGLAIVQWAVKLHGGHVRVEPRPSGGNTFVVELPAN